jgi:hypothetical protein
VEKILDEGMNVVARFKGKEKFDLGFLVFFFPLFEQSIKTLIISHA